MTAEVVRVIGIPGGGKTMYALDEIARIIEEEFVDPMEIGFSSMTRVARQEAAERVESRFGTPAEDLMKFGGFKTLHATCLRALGGAGAVGLLSDNVESTKWVADSLGAPYVTTATEDDVITGISLSSSHSFALSMWAIARSRMTSLREQFDKYELTSTKSFLFNDVYRIVSDYEAAKYRDGRSDFIDLTGMFSGWRFDVDDEPISVNPRGECPNIPVWFFDEHQDASHILHAVVLRLIQSESCYRAYVLGDPAQAIFEFSGATHLGLSEGIEPDREVVLNKSWRCPKGVLDLSEQVYRKCDDYVDRKPIPRVMDDGVTMGRPFNEFIDKFDPSREWLMLARTNFLSKRYHSSLSAKGIPWDHVKSDGGYVPVSTRRVGKVFADLQEGIPVSAHDWKYAVRVVKSGSGDHANFRRGVKVHVDDGRLKVPQSLTLENLEDAGATESLVNRIKRDEWQSIVPKVSTYLRARREHGSLADKPRVRVGTIHSVKGSEAECVALMDGISYQCACGRTDPETADSERRVTYVGITRAKEELHVLQHHGDKYRMEF